MITNDSSTDREARPAILIVDDEVTVQDSLKIILNYQGYDVDLASSGKEGLECLGKKHFDLLVLDLKMPDMNGFDILTHVRNQYPQLKVILITGFGTLDIARQALAQGAMNYFDKPIDLNRFIQKVKKALSD
ncbi:response regulator [bacterium]|nr:response regulator [candidate division CSSED10-310 bacterium]